MIQLQGIKLMVLPNKVTQNVELFVEALENCRVTRLFAVTSLIRNILALLEMEKKKDKKSRLSNVSMYYQLMLIICNIFIMAGNIKMTLMYITIIH